MPEIVVSLAALVIVSLCLKQTQSKTIKVKFYVHRGQQFLAKEIFIKDLDLLLLYTYRLHYLSIIINYILLLLLFLLSVLLFVVVVFGQLIVW